MSLELLTAFTIGLVGSLHCVGMCGPIALALPQSFDRKSTLLLSRLLWSAGRILTYAVLGLIAGFLGQSFAFIGLAQTLTIVTGAVMILAVLFPFRVLLRLIPPAARPNLTARIQSYWGTLFKKRGLMALFVIGLLNGLLPCGLVYVAMAAAATTGQITTAMLYMVLFGMGTAPALIAVSLFGGLFSLKVRQAVNRFIPVGIVVLGLLLIMRGMGLGIPLISPKFDQSKPITEQPACH
jgi:sulfite exporter TauE/SafE